MPAAHGSDRVRTQPDGTSIVSCRHPKTDWAGRQSKASGRGTHPGTAIDWDGVIHEVIRVDESPGLVRYHLQPWRENETIRLVLRYDEESEAERARRRESARTRDRLGTIAVLGSLVTGHLPAHVQSEIESDYGFPAWILTFISALPLAIAGGFAYIFLAASMFGGGGAAPVSGALLVTAAIVGLLEIARLVYAVSTQQPIGSLAGWLLSPLLPAARRSRRVSTSRKYESERLWVRSIDPDAERLARDEMELRVHLIALLKPSEQEIFVRRFGFDFRRWTRVTAFAIALIAGTGIASAIVRMRSGDASFLTLISVAAATALLIEQLVRLRFVGRGEMAGSLLAPLARPFVSTLLQRSAGELRDEEETGDPPV